MNNTKDSPVEGWKKKWDSAVYCLPRYTLSAKQLEMSVNGVLSIDSQQRHGLILQVKKEKWNNLIKYNKNTLVYLAKLKMK